MQVIEIKCFSKGLLDALNDLLPQLSSSSIPLSEDRLLAILRSDAAHLLMAEENGTFLGTLTLVVFTIPSGIRARIEDLVVQTASRSRGAGQALVRKAMALAQSQGADAVELTAHPSRAEARRLYEKLGFERREAHVYRRTLAGTATRQPLIRGSTP